MDVGRQESRLRGELGAEPLERAADRHARGIDRGHAEALRNIVREVRTELPFVIDAMVVLPDHWHAVWTLPPNDAASSAGPIEPWNGWSFFVRNTSLTSGLPRRWT